MFRQKFASFLPGGDNRASHARVILMANHLPGLEVAKYLKERGDDIVRLYTVSADDPMGQAIADVVDVDWDRCYYGRAPDEPGHLDDLNETPFDYIVTVYWPYLLPKPFYTAATKGTVNFHPALLPVNRGWYPHVHSLVDGSKAGITLHAIDDGVDSGPIWAQKEILPRPTDTAKTLYDRLQDEIVSLFKEIWPDIIAGRITPTPQASEGAIYHKKRDVKQIDRIDPDKQYTGEEIINILRARSFGDRGFAYIDVDGEKVYLNLRLGESPDFASLGETRDEP